MSKSKLERVMQLVINNKSQEAAALLHEVFIEKARGIHESLMHEDDEFEDMDTLGGDDGDRWKSKIKKPNHDLDEMGADIDSEESFGSHMEGLVFEEDDEDEDKDEDVVVVDGDDDDITIDDEDGEGEDEFDDEFGSSEEGDEDGEHDHEDGDVDDRLSDLEDTLEQLKAEFDEIQARFGDDDDLDGDEDGDDMGDEPKDDFGGEDDMGDEPEAMDEDWLEEQFADLEESLKLDVLKTDMYTGGDKDEEIGDGPAFAKPNANHVSPVAKSQTSLMGAKPVVSGRGTKHSGYDRETPPTGVYGITSGEKDGMPKEAKKDNRRKNSMSGMEDMSSGNYGAKKVSGSRLETTADEFKTGRTKGVFQNIKRDGMD